MVRRILFAHHGPECNRRADFNNKYFENIGGAIMKKGMFVFVLMGVCAVTSPAFAAKGEAMIKATAPDSPISGEVSLEEKGEGLEIEVKVVNVPLGKHGFHIHENGSCDDMGKAAGGHFNPDSVMHGLVARDGFVHAHAGDFGNIEVGEDGTGSLKFFVPGLTLTGLKYNVTGKAVILHEKEDDFGQPTGNAGGRIGCGIITIIEEDMMKRAELDTTPEAVASKSQPQQSGW